MTTQGGNCTVCGKSNSVTKVHESLPLSRCEPISLPSFQLHHEFCKRKDYVFNSYLRIPKTYLVSVE